MITQQQHKLLMYIQKCIAERGYAPSYDEMRDALGLKSKSGVHRLVYSLEERGYVNRLPNRARAVEVLRVPQERFGMKDKDVLRAMRGKFTPAKNENPYPGLAEAKEGTMIPLYGKIAAGTPISALRDPSEFIEVPGFMVGFGDYYALRIEGDSMKDAGIAHNDIVIVEKQETASDGDIVVALIDKEEATLKRIKYVDERVQLHPANRHYKVYELDPKRVIIQGKLRGLLRAYK
ncbi:MAG: transcriptional repressor LexA [Alphaproteobacteria bacterium]|nr:transcriptional repressor LexA [Alphaproteobacteria bacterium]